MNRHLTFPKSRRVRSRLDFSSVFEAGVREARGPLVLFGIPNATHFCRLGVSTPKRVGNAVRRNRMRRLLREAFRRLQHDLPAPYDLVLVVRPHEPLELAQYDDLLKQLVARLHRDWTKKTDPSGVPTAPVPPG